MTTWFSDANGNRASLEYWGSEAAARASLATLENCRNCDNCSGCSRCSYCSYCSGCSRCSGCSDCSYCSDCSGCSRCSRLQSADLSKPWRRLPVSDPRGYSWLAVHDGEEWRVYAGCRVGLSPAKAREHWLADNYPGPQSVKETVGFALDWILTQKPEQVA